MTSKGFIWSRNTARSVLRSTSPKLKNRRKTHSTAFLCQSSTMAAYSKGITIMVGSAVWDWSCKPMAIPSLGCSSRASKPASALSTGSLTASYMQESGWAAYHMDLESTLPRTSTRDISPTASSTASARNASSTATPTWVIMR